MYKNLIKTSKVTLNKDNSTIQIEVPLEIKEYLDLEENNLVLWRIENGQVIIDKLE